MRNASSTHKVLKNGVREFREASQRQERIDTDTEGLFGEAAAAVKDLQSKEQSVRRQASAASSKTQSLESVILAMQQQMQQQGEAIQQQLHQQGQEMQLEHQMDMSTLSQQVEQLKQRPQHAPRQPLPFYQQPQSQLDLGDPIDAIQVLQCSTLIAAGRGE